MLVWLLTYQEDEINVEVLGNTVFHRKMFCILQDVKTATGGFVTSEHLRTFHWSSPERLCGKEYSRNTDIW